MKGVLDGTKSSYTISRGLYIIKGVLDCIKGVLNDIKGVLDGINEFLNSIKEVLDSIKRVLGSIKGVLYSIKRGNAGQILKFDRLNILFNLKVFILISSLLAQLNLPYKTMVFIYGKSAHIAHT